MAASKIPGSSRPMAAWLGLMAPLALAWVSGCSAGNDTPGVGVGGPGVGGGGSVAGSGPGAGSGGGGLTRPAECAQISPGTARIRRLTRFEYNNAVRDIFGDASQPANALPGETIGREGNFFGNDAALLSVSTLLADQWGKVAEGVATRATATPAALGAIAPCAAGATPDDACARTVIDKVVSKAYHRDVPAAENDSFLTLFKSVQAKSTFASAVAAVIEDVLQGPEFLYRVELGTPAAEQPGLRRPTGDEMAARLAFLFLGSVPDEGLRTAAKAGQLTTPAGIRAQAQRLVESPQARSVVSFFFDNLLPISGLTNLARDRTLYPAFSQTVAAAMREETQQFLAHEIFDAGSPGTWASALTAPYTYVNEDLAKFYGIPGVTGPEFRKVQLPDPTKRLGLLTQAGVMTGTITTDKSNPVLRGSFVVNKIMCIPIHLPTDPEVLKLAQTPVGVTGATARERFTQHRAQAICAGCHSILDPVGFALENYDAVGQWRDKEVSTAVPAGAPIDASGQVPGTGAAVNGPVELVKGIAATEAAQNCFAQHWIEFGFGKTIDPQADSCTQKTINAAFKASGGNIKQLLVDLTQTDAFLYLPAKD